MLNSNESNQSCKGSLTVSSNVNFSDWNKEGSSKILVLIMESISVFKSNTSINTIEDPKELVSNEKSISLQDF